MDILVETYYLKIDKKIPFDLIDSIRKFPQLGENIISLCPLIPLANERECL